MGGVIPSGGVPNSWKEDTALDSLIILGAGGFAREIVWHARDAYPGVTIALVDDLSGITEVAVGGQVLPVVGDWDFSRFPDSCFARFVVGVGDPQSKRVMVRKALDCGLRPADTIVHPKAVVQDVDLGVGGVIAPGCVLTANIHVGNYVLLGINVSIGHDAQVGDYVTCNPGAIVSGNTQLGPGSYVGAGAFLREKTRIAPGVTVGAQACVTKDITEAGITVAGVPARHQA